MRRALFFITAGCALAACVPPGNKQRQLRPVLDTNGSMDKQADVQLSALCARNNMDAVAEALCGKPKPELHDLSGLAAHLGLGFGSVGTNPGFVLNAHSTSLLARGVSAINPRAIVFRPPSAQTTGMPDREFLAMVYTRGEQFVELAVRTGASPLVFYLLKFEQACNADQTCGPGDLLTPAAEKGWTNWTLYQDIDLRNTTYDCLACHQPGGPSSPKILRMPELHDPWTHYMKSDRSGGKALLDDFHAAHGTTEDYGAIPAHLIEQSDPAKLTDLIVRNGFGDQPNEFKGAVIEAEVKTSNAAEPSVNVPPGTSATWSILYENALMGMSIAPPYHDVKVTDPMKLQAMTAAYKMVRTGSAAAAALPDIRDVLLDAALPDMSVRPKAGLDGHGILVQMCASCHNGRLDPSVSRARFTIERLDQMSRDEKDKAIRRMQLPASDPGHMPPQMVRSLSDAEQALVIDELLR